MRGSTGARGDGESWALILCDGQGEVQAVQTIPELEVVPEMVRMAPDGSTLFVSAENGARLYRLPRP
jgi:hypothetical protein